MKVSMVVATNKSTFWSRFCDALSQNSVETEVIFVGPVGSVCPKLLVQTWFIDVPDRAVGAAKCWEIGARKANGDLLGLATDDVVFTPGFLDAVVAEASKPHNIFDMFSAKYFHNGKDESGGSCA